MASKIWIPLVLSVVLGLGAAIIAGRTLRSPKAAPPATEVGVLVAAHDIDAGSELTAADFMPVKYPVKNVPPEAITDPRQLANRITLAPMLKGQMPGEHMLASVNTPSGMQALVPIGMRAITLEVNEFSGVAGFVVPGCHVDLIANVRDDRVKETGSRTIVQDIQILATGRILGTGNASKDPSAPPPPVANSVTVLVTPKQAQAIALANQGSRPWLVLRGYKDDKHFDPGLTKQADLRGDTDDFLNYLASLVTPEPGEATTVANNRPATTQPTAPLIASRPFEDRPQRIVRLINGNVEERLAFQGDPVPQPQFGTIAEPSPK